MKFRFHFFFKKTHKGNNQTVKPCSEERGNLTIKHSHMILVTGGTGLTGSHLLRKLVADGKQSIRAIKRTTSSLELVTDIADQIEWMDADVLDVPALSKAMEGVKQVYHNAAIVSFVPSMAEKMKAINVQGTANMVNLAMEKGVEKFLHVSSISSLGRRESGGQVDENTKWEPSPFNTNYAKSKYYSEKEVWRAAAEGLKVVIVNPSAIVGAGNWDSGSSRMFSRIYEGLKFYPTGGTGYIDVRDLVNVMGALMDSDIEGERFIVSADNLAYKTFFEMIAQALGMPAPNREATPFLSAIAWRMEALKAKFTGRPPLITKETIAQATRRYYYDNSKVRKALNYTFKSVEASVKEVAAAYLQEVAK